MIRIIAIAALAALAACTTPETGPDAGPAACLYTSTPGDPGTCVDAELVCVDGYCEEPATGEAAP